MPEALLDKLELSHYKYDKQRCVFVLSEDNSVFSIKELLRILSLLEEEDVACEVDKDSNIIVL